MSLGAIEEFIEHGKSAFLKCGTMVPNFYWETESGRTGAVACIVGEMADGGRSQQHMLAAIFGRLTAKKLQDKDDALKRVIFGAEVWALRGKDMPSDHIPNSLVGLPNTKEILVFINLDIKCPDRHKWMEPGQEAFIKSQGYTVDILRRGSSTDLGAVRKEDSSRVDSTMPEMFISGWESYRVDDPLAALAGAAMDHTAAQLGLSFQEADDFLAGL